MSELEIKIRRNRKASTSTVRGPIHVPQKTDEGKRRVKPGGIKFFDLSMLKDGSDYVKLDYYFVDTNGSDRDLTLGDPANLFNEEPTGGGFFNGLAALVLAVPLDQFSAKWKQIQQGTYEALNTTFTYHDHTLGTITTSLLGSAKFVDGQWKLTSAEADSIILSLQSVMFNLDYDKITLNPVSTDTDVSGTFHLKNNAEVYMMPQVINQFSLTDYYNGLDPTTGVTKIERNEVAFQGFFIFDRTLASQYLHATGLTGYDQWYYYWHDVLKTNSAGHQLLARYERKFNPTPPHDAMEYYTTPAVSAFPASYYTPTGVVNVDANNRNISYSTQFDFYASGKKGLKAIIKSGGHWYYLWNTTGTLI